MDMLRARFRARAATQAEALAQALAEEERATVVAVSHKLAGSAALFGAAEVGVLAAALEREAEGPAGWETIRAVAEPLLAGLRDAAQDAD